MNKMDDRDNSDVVMSLDVVVKECKNDRENSDKHSDFNNDSLSNVEASENLENESKPINNDNQNICERNGELVSIKNSSNLIEISDSSCVSPEQQIYENIGNYKQDLNCTEQKQPDEIIWEDQNSKNKNLRDDVEMINECDVLNEKSLECHEENQYKNYKNVILEDWAVETNQVVENHDSENISDTITTETPQMIEVVKTQEIECSNDNDCTILKVTETKTNDLFTENEQNNGQSFGESSQENSNSILENEIIKLMTQTKADSSKYSKSISKNDIVKILDESTERVVKPIVTGKDLFFSIELTKRLNQKLSQNKSSKKSETLDKLNLTNENEAFNNNNTLDDRQKIVEILEADEIKDWKSVPSKSDSNLKENGNDMDISKAIKSMEGKDSSANAPMKTTKKAVKKFKAMDKELERAIALQQLRKEFPTTRKRTRTTKKINHIPFLASTVLEKALTSPEVTTALKPGPPKRRPCYLPDNKSDPKHSEKSNKNESQAINSTTALNEHENAANNDVSLKANKSSEILSLDLDSSANTSIPNAVVKTYSAKRKSTDAENSIKSTLETIAAVTKALSESAEESNESKPKKQKTVFKSVDKLNKKVNCTKNKGKSGSGKRNSELEKLLGDEGAVRMLYETQHKEGSSDITKKSKTKTTAQGLKKDLVLKTKLVKNAVMRLSGVSTEGVRLRGKGRTKIEKPDVIQSEPLFSSTPNIVFYKPKKKQRAEASRILYRHSSSESFDSSEGYRRTSFDDVGLNESNKEADTLKIDSEAFNGAEKEVEKFIIKAKPKKAEVFVKKRLKRLQSTKVQHNKKGSKDFKSRGLFESSIADSSNANTSKLNLSRVPLRKSSRPRMISKKYSVWSSTSMDSLSVESLGLKKFKKASPELGKKLNCKELTILQYEHLVQVILNPVSTFLKNSLNVEVLEELKQVFSFLAEESTCKAVLLSSTGNTFCQGIDINYIISLNENDKEIHISQLVKIIGEVCICLSDFKKPLIAGVHAAAIGFGVTLLPYCDLVVASDKASFYTPYVKLGQAPEGAPTQTFPHISRHLVSELLIKSHKMTASEASKCGLITHIIPEERFEEELISLSRNMAAQPSQGIQAIKSLLRSSQHNEIVEVLRMEGEMLEKHWTSIECRNNMIKFINSGELQLKQFDAT